ncbi:MAG: DHH family phosphoesterase, partial [Desulfobulbales bacterium]
MNNMDIITTHLNADFDALASMVAAKKLYPDAELVFSGSQEKVVRDYLSQEFRDIYSIKRLKNINLEKVRRLIVVDTRQPNRIGKLQECLNNPGLELHIYDHHPSTSGDMTGDMEVIELVGSTSTIFVRLFQDRNIILTPDEATLLALGIYEDTGTFLHTTTTGADLGAASWLLEHGANLDIVNQFVSKDLSARQVGMLGNLLKNATTYTIQSIEIVVTKLTLQEYVDSFAVILHRLMVMENLDVLFGLICMGERTYLIARSRIPEVNV